MDDQLLPPYAEPTGPLNDDDSVVRAFANGYYGGHSPRFHVEGDALIVDRMDAAALRVGPTTLLVRIDLPDDLMWGRPVVEQVLEGEGFSCIDRDSLFAAPVAIQILGLRLSSWDLWGTEIEEAFRRLRAAAVGDECNPVLGSPGRCDSQL
ncbi:MAG: hypothetical protein QOJ52_4337 [Acidimicrobiaceae bacterium]|nr:hypothetical protein [Acidimicrobiaceae bacterium]